jgi:hypothetical protein
MMNEKLKAIKEKAIIEAQKIDPENESIVWDLFATMIIKESVDVVKQTGKQCAYTTHDLIAVNCTIDKCASTLENYFKE